MLRSEGIPCKLITGYVGEETYHAWNSFYVESEGWITVEIRAKADECCLLYTSIIFGLLKLGLPVGIMNSITAIGGMILQGIVNSLGSTIEMCIRDRTTAAKMTP